MDGKGGMDGLMDGEKEERLNGWRKEGGIMMDGLGGITDGGWIEGLTDGEKRGEDQMGWAGGQRDECIEKVGEMTEDGWREGRKGRREPTISHGIQDGHAAGVPSLANAEDGPLPSDHLPYHNGEAEDITAVRVVAPWGKVVSDTHALIPFPNLSHPGWEWKYDLTFK